MDTISNVEYLNLDTDRFVAAHGAALEAQRRTPLRRTMCRTDRAETTDGGRAGGPSSQRGGVVHGRRPD